MINHPVHIYDQVSKQLSPSSLIPLCDFGGDMFSMGLKIDQFNTPVCHNFKAKILNDQLCYEVDLNRYKDSFSNNKLNQGLTLYIDTNIDRQYPRGNQTNEGIRAANLFHYHTSIICSKIHRWEKLYGTFWNTR